MSNQNQPRTTPHGTLYSMDPSAVLALRVGAVGLVLGAIGLPSLLIYALEGGLAQADPIILGTAALVAVLLLGIAWLVYSIPQRTSLLLSPRGIVYSTLFHRVQTPWSNVDRLAVPGHLARRGIGDEALVLREPARPTASLWGQLEQRRGGSSHLLRSIPLSTFDKHWRTGQLGAELRRYAPQLFSSPGV